MKTDNTLLYGLILIIACFLQSASAKAATEPHQFHHPQQALQKITGKPNAGKKIYQSYCANCHAQEPIIPLGAPRAGHKTDWEPRLKQGMKKLFEHTTLGLNNMPARGGCFECSDKLLMAAVRYMLPKEK